MGLRFVGPRVGTYRTILMDPPWPKAQGGGRIRRGADRHYRLMRLRDIMALPVRDLADPAGCHLWMWAIGNQLDDAIDALRAYGARLINCRPWVKADPVGETWRPQRIGIGQYLGSDAEFLLFGRFGPPMPYRTHQGRRIRPRQTLYGPRTRTHSQKPAQSRPDIELVSPGPYIELFARDPQPGWDCWGEAVQHCSSDQLVSEPEST